MISKVIPLVALLAVCAFAQDKDTLITGTNITNINTVDTWTAIEVDIHSVRKLPDHHDIIRIVDQGKLLLVVHSDGTITNDKDFAVDDDARAFWRVMARTYVEVCR